MKNSVIIPACNAEHSLEQTIESVLRQSLPAYEIIVVDDGSEDGTADIARGYGTKVILLQQQNLGQGAARNRGLERASGEAVAFLDADDFWLPEFLETTAAFLESHPEAVAVNTAFKTLLREGRETIGPPCVTAGTCREAVVLEDFFAFWAEQDHVRTGTVLIRKSVIEQAGLQRAELRISQDLEYWGWLATFGKWGFIPEPLWVGNSRQAARKSGWRRKYQKRRRLCPTVEAWQERILPKLTTEQLPYFEKVRGRVAAGYAHAKLLGGDSSGALEIARCYGGTMPDNRVVRLMRAGVCCRPAWAIACAILRLRESLK